MSLSQVLQLKHELRQAEAYLTHCKAQRNYPEVQISSAKVILDAQVKKAARKVWEIKKQLAVLTEEQS